VTTRWALLALCVAVSGCQIVKVYEGAALRADPARIVIGETTLADVLQEFGAPARIQRRADGDVLTYRYNRQDSRTLTIEEPVVTNTELFTYTTIREDSELLVVLLDPGGVVRAVGYRDGASALDR